MRATTAPLGRLTRYRFRAVRASVGVSLPRLALAPATPSLPPKIIPKCVAFRETSTALNFLFITVGFAAMAVLKIWT